MGHILKADEVKLEGQFHLDLVQVKPRSPESKSSALEPAVSMVENHPEFAVMEITCSCGTRMFLRCEYGNVEARAEAAAPQAGT